MCELLLYNGHPVMKKHVALRGATVVCTPTVLGLRLV